MDKYPQKSVNMLCFFIKKRQKYKKDLYLCSVNRFY